MKLLRELNIVPIVIFSFIQNTKCSFPSCPAKFVCPNTTITSDLSNRFIFQQVKRDFIRDFWNSSVAQNLPNPSQNALKLIQLVQFYSNTDSPKFLNTLYLYSMWVDAHTLRLDQYPTFCIAAKNINGSVIWAKEEDGQEAAEAIKEIVRLIQSICYNNLYAAFLNAKCKDLVTPPLPSDECYGRGEVYRIEEALEIYGKFLPCDLKYLLLDLYESKQYLDKLFVAMFIMGLVETTTDFHDRLNHNAILETKYIRLNKIPYCCCSHLINRSTKLCHYHIDQHNLMANYLIANKYLAPKCKK